MATRKQQAKQCIEESWHAINAAKDHIIDAMQFLEGDQESADANKQCQRVLEAIDHVGEFFKELL